LRQFFRLPIREFCRKNTRLQGQVARSCATPLCTSKSASPIGLTLLKVGRCPDLPRMRWAKRIAKSSQLGFGKCCRRSGRASAKMSDRGGRP
jgi:hypothetical protein